MKKLASILTTVVLGVATSATAQNTTTQSLTSQPSAAVTELTATNHFTQQNGNNPATSSTNFYMGELPQNKQQREHDLANEYPQEVEMQILPGGSKGVFIVRAPNNETILSVQVLDFRGTPMPVRIGNFMNKPQDKELDMGFEGGAPRHVIVRTTGGTYTTQIMMTR